MARKINWRSVKKHRSYTVDEAARALGLAKGTVRRWMKGGLTALTDRKPALILGEDLIDFLRSRAKPKQRCRVDECFCFRCRRPRAPSFGEVEFKPSEGGGGMITALCEACTTTMFKRISQNDLAALREIVTVRDTEADGHISEDRHPSLNDHLPRKVATHA
ncbi:helix-turn-helix domain-containing protein [Hyphobacterium sp.]|uniref:helix-turn-helix domain-containing protein n=1 Tax=Hyphobacterium sp. TaxID=2004662 RepID=UPI003B517031